VTVVLKVYERHKLDVILSRFLANTSKTLIVVMITIISLGKLGISVTPFITAIGAISLSAGLSLQGLLANYAVGFNINIIIIRPFVVGDTITVRGVTGLVKEVLLAYTILLNEVSVEITVPNKHILGEILHNLSHESLLELSIDIDYSENPLAVVALLEEVIGQLDIVSKARKPLIGIDAFADSSINIAVRLWTPTENLYSAKYKANKEIYSVLNKANIKIPLLQRDVHLIKDVV
jgi:small conductance mechanosensitive channel